MKLYLVRHGQSTGNVGGTLMGQSDHPLTELGEAQARAAAAHLAPFGPMPVRCSDLPRALATAEHIAAAWEARVVPDARLREIDLGDYEGRSWEEFEADEELKVAFADDPYGTALPDGESLAHVETRVLAAVRDVLVARGVGPEGDLSTDAVANADASALATGFHVTDPGQNACIVAHDGPIRAILNHYLGVPPEKWWTLSTTHGGVSLLEFSRGWVNIRYVNATSHLAGLGDSVYVPSEPGDEPAAG
ncbi:MAG: histidine phosphatase family protein [Actinobacteria bacterium]|nr:histidine phosphatase family protein [Actinomycetota bacterium]